MEREATDCQNVFSQNRSTVKKKRKKRITFSDPSTPDCASELFNRICICAAVTAESAGMFAGWCFLLSVRLSVVLFFFEVARLLLSCHVHVFVFLS